MNKSNRLMKIAIAALPAVLMAGSASTVLLAALQVPCAASAVWLPALAAAVLCGMAAWSVPLAIAAAVIAAVGGGVAAVANPDALGGIQSMLLSMLAPAAETAADSAAHGPLLGGVAAVLLTALLFLLLHKPGGTPFALLVEFTVLIGSYALREDMSFGMAVPGLIASLAAFAMAGGVQKDSGAWRALIPAVLCVAAALLLTPADRVTWGPLENAATRVRTAFEDYFHFTQERIPFTIGTEGYNHAAEVDGSVISALGGPATPDTEPVMKVSATDDVLLRGAIRRNYTGNTWEDRDAKARYLYLDFTRRNVREHVFGMKNNKAFSPVRVQVEMLDEGTSTLFVPARMGEFNMPLETAVHYNSIGEIFLSQPVQPGDAYDLIGYVVRDEDAARKAIADAQGKKDEAYSEIRSACTQLPSGIAEGVYALAIEITQDCDNPYDKAAAIESWLRNNCEYTLTPDYPDVERDFVSQFLLEDRRGYCSYFASAMTVMCRIAGLPARYVEGYSIDAGTDVIVTGEDAHAWTEVYFNGIGWVPFNPANGAGGGEDGRSNEGEYQGGENAGPTEAPESGNPDETLEPETDPTLPPNDGSEDSDNSPTPSPDPQLAPTPSPSPTPDGEDWAGTLPDATPEPTQQPELPDLNDSAQKNRAGLWILLLILLILLAIAAAVLWIRRRLEANEPVRMSAKAETAQQAALILYRAILTVLALTGQSPLSGETPAAFARRVSEQTDNPAFAEFAEAVAMSAYARAGVNREIVENGRYAYAVFLQGLKKGEKLRYAWIRIRRGIGDFENIP